MDGAHPLLWTCGLQVQIPAHPMFQVPVSIRRSDRTDPSIAQTRSKPLCGRDLGRSQEDQCLAHRTRQGGNPGNAAKLRCVVAVVVVVAACCCVCVCLGLEGIKDRQHGSPPKKDTMCFSFRTRSNLITPSSAWSISVWCTWYLFDHGRMTR